MLIWFQILTQQGISFHFIFGFYTYSIATTPAQRLSHSEWGVTTWAGARFHPRNGWISTAKFISPYSPAEGWAIEQCALNAHLLRKKRNERPKSLLDPCVGRAAGARSREKSRELALKAAESWDWEKERESLPACLPAVCRARSTTLRLSWPQLPKSTAARIQEGKEEIQKKKLITNYKFIVVIIL